jgi:large subunit ribosomal protein L21
MFAVIATGGKQYNVAPNTILDIERLPGSPGETISLEDVRAFYSAAGATLGQPSISGAKVVAEILTQHRSKKVIVFKKKRRQNYRRKNGHRQDLTRIRVLELIAADGKTLAKAEPKKTPTSETSAA